MTLPERVLRRLETVDADRAKAIARLTDLLPGASDTSRSLVDVVPVSTTRAVILVANSRLLRTVPWLRLVEVGPARHLLSVLPGTSIEKLEITISDLLDLASESDQVERDILERLRQCLRGTRRDQKVSKEEILLVELTP